MISDDFKRSFSGLAGKVKEGGKQIGTQAQLQVNLKKLQVRYARRIHELGKETFDWYRAGTLIISGPVPSEVSKLCGELDDIQAKIRETQRQIEEVQTLSVPPPAAPESTLGP